MQLPVLLNYTLAFGCQPGVGVIGNTKFVQDLIAVIKDNVHIDSGTVEFPKVLMKVKPTDAKFE